MTEMKRACWTVLAVMVLSALVASCGAKKTESPEAKAKLDSDMKANMNKAYGAGGPGAKAPTGGAKAPTEPK